jgi:hypothetical protein
LQQADGAIEVLPGVAYFNANAADRLTIKTPAGDGFARII